MTRAKQIQKTESKSTEKDALLTEELLNIETSNYANVKNAVDKVNKAIEVQKQTTAELELQGEKLAQIKDTSVSTWRNAMASQEVSHQIRQESSIFPSFNSLFRGIKRWWKKDKRMEREVERMSKRSVKRITAEIKDENTFVPLEQEAIPGENKTDGELEKLLNGVRRMNAEAQAQLDLIEDQNGLISDINKVTDYSDALIDNTEKEVRKK